MKDSFLLPRLMDRSQVIDLILNRIMTLADEKAWRVEIEEAKGRRTLEQNALLWSMYGQILKRGGETMGGWTKDDLHTFFLMEHFGEEIRTIFGKKRRVPARRSSTLNKVEFSDLVDHIVSFMREQGVVLEMPEKEEAW